MKRINITHATVAFAVAGALAASAALAGEKPKKKSAAPVAAQPVQQTFEHVTVVNASPELIAKLAVEQKSAIAMRAYVDSAGNLRGATQEEIEADSAAAAPQARVAARSAFARSAAPAAPAAAQATRTESGLTAYDLGESTMVYSVVTVDANGKLKQDCVTGADNASKAVLTRARPEVANEK